MGSFKGYCKGLGFRAEGAYIVECRVSVIMEFLLQYDLGKYPP